MISPLAVFTRGAIQRRNRLLIITVSCLRYYLQGMLAGAIKG